jgi:hypothetical protein
MSLKDSWKQTGVGLGHAFRDLGKSVVKSVATGVKKVDNWANKEEKPVEYEPEKEQPAAEWQAEVAEPVKTVVEVQPRENASVEWKAE